MTASPAALKIDGVVSQDVATMVGGTPAEALQRVGQALASAGYINQSTNPETMTVEGWKTKMTAGKVLNPLTGVISQFPSAGQAGYNPWGDTQRVTVALQPVKDGHWATVTVDDPKAMQPLRSTRKSRPEKEVAKIVGLLNTPQDSQSAAPGWYPVDNRPGTQGYWDGERYLKFAPLDASASAERQLQQGELDRIASAKATDEQISREAAIAAKRKEADARVDRAFGKKKKSEGLGGK